YEHVCLAAVGGELSDTAADDNFATDQEDNCCDVPPTQTLAQNDDGEHRRPKHQGVAPKRRRRRLALGEAVEEQDEGESPTDDPEIREPEPLHPSSSRRYVARLGCGRNEVRGRR